MENLTKSLERWLKNRPFLADASKTHQAIYNVLDSFDDKATAEEIHQKLLTTFDGKFSDYLARVANAKVLSYNTKPVGEVWNQSICPICSSKPNMAELKATKRGRERFLSCPNCRTTWSYKRIGCPYCKTEDQAKLHILSVDEEPDIRIDVCDNCNSYIKTYVGEGNRSIALDDWASSHLDILCKSTKYSKQGNLLEVE